VEERKAVICKYVSSGMKVDMVTKMVGISKSSYYYKSRHGKPGRKPSTHTGKENSPPVENGKVVEKIRSIVGKEFMENGYRKVTSELKDLGFFIGKKKTYRLMREGNLLLRKKVNGSRNYTPYTQPLPFEPFEKLEIDIKYMYIRGERKNALLLTVLDTFTRIALAWNLQYSIRHTAVGKLFDQVIDQWLQHYRPPDQDEDVTVTLRCDNDGRFLAHDLQGYLKENFIHQEFIYPSTPEQNAHIESFHSVVEELVCKKYEFNDIHHARQVLDRFYQTYNHRRTIGSLLYLPPMVFLQEWENSNMGLMMKKENGRIKQTFFFRGQRPKWLSALPEDFIKLGNSESINNFDTCVEHILNES
jgi:putative transposase